MKFFKYEILREVILVFRQTDVGNNLIKLNNYDKKKLNSLFKKKEILFLEDLNIKIVGDLKKVNSSLTLDGGSKTLYLKDSQENSFEVFLPYHKITKKGFTKGRMHINNYPIKVRSKEEAQLLEQLSNIIKKEPKNSMVRDVVNFVKSEKYIEISENYPSNYISLM